MESTLSSAAGLSTAKLFEETQQQTDDTDSCDSADRRSYAASCCGYRWLTVVLLSLGMVVVHAQRVNVAVSLLAVYDNLEDKVGNHAARENVSYYSCWLVYIFHH